jgi:UDP-glucose 4-epimerase
MKTESQSKRWLANDPVVRSFYNRRKVLVIGADGFLGINCVYALQELGAHVSLLTRRAIPRAACFSGPVFRGDLKDQWLMRSAVDNQTIVFDFAGASGAVDSNEKPLQSLEEDCRSHLSLFQACAAVKEPPIVVFCSSRLVYGKPRYLPVDESHPLSPQSVYAVHKITVENYLRVFGHTRGLRSCILRLSNPYGPHQPRDARGYGIINQFIRAASEGVPIRIYGDGSQQRDYIYVDDVITMFLLCAVHEKCHDQTFNVGGRHGISIKTAVEQIVRLAGGPSVYFEPWPRDYKVIETGDYRTDLRKIDDYLALPPQTSFEEGVSRTLDYYLKGCSVGQSNQLG